MSSAPLAFSKPCPLQAFRSSRLVANRARHGLLVIAGCFAIASCTPEDSSNTESIVPTPQDKAEVWITDFESAKTTAATAGKDLFIEFTGSDWCAPCIRFEREVLSKDAFLEAALPGFVLVKLDFPKDESVIDPALVKQNDALYERYQIEGFPSVILADSSGKPYAEIEEYNVSVDEYLPILEHHRQKRVSRDEAFSTAHGLTGIEKANALRNGLESTGLKYRVVAAFYQDILDSIITNDPDDTTGLARKGRAHERMLRLMKGLDEAAAAGDFQAALPMIDEALKFDAFAPDDIQQLLLMRAITQGQLEQYDEAIRAAEEAINAAPGTPVIPNIEQLIADFAAARDALAEEDQ